ncbi:type II secretion system inner membrane protein GspF [Pedomonas mirosovicensis]|uniref:type II secretion system inner membrane protein GspF n=1 Tax=Pedomonas mirosovicensis TaxID=2908641 RepID=UPI00216996C7|nr:type II secretion system inner membrane protein GspF [Pedomonas mirosovicensis]MCH8686346.1 type II secretion system inner membrane protein GspF [Pedomonas mirosovicensis]
MAAFEYEALDADGKTRKGIISADSLRQARSELKRRKLFPVSVAAAHERRRAASRLRFERHGRMGTRDVTLLTRQLATLVAASAPVEEALQMVALQAEKPVVKRTMLAIRARVMEGYRLSAALAEEPRTFGSLYRAMVAAGESSGALGPVLERLADHLEKSQQLRSKIITSLTYPFFLALVAVGVIAALMAFVVPKVVDQFTGMGQELPALTNAMIAASHAVRTLGLPMLVALLLGLAAFGRALQREEFRRRVDRVVLRLPVVGRLVRDLQTARFARTMATLLASGCSVLDGLEASRQILRNMMFRDAVGDMMAQIREGSSLSAALRRSKAFPPMIGYMAASGENSGRLDDMLGKAAQYLEREFEDFTAAALSLLEPAIIIVMGGVVATIVLSILLPILRLNSLALT